MSMCDSQSELSLTRKPNVYTPWASHVGLMPFAIFTLCIGEASCRLMFAAFLTLRANTRDST